MLPIIAWRVPGPQAIYVRLAPPYGADDFDWSFRRPTGVRIVKGVNGAYRLLEELQQIDNVFPAFFMSMCLNYSKRIMQGVDQHWREGDDADGSYVKVCMADNPTSAYGDTDTIGAEHARINQEIEARKVEEQREAGERRIEEAKARVKAAEEHRMAARKAIAESAKPPARKPRPFRYSILG